MNRKAWRIHLVIMVLTWALLSATAMAMEAEKKPGPAAVFPEKTYQFDPVLEGIAVSHVFKVQNKGNEELLIQRVKPG
jgi:hypothetical protein